MLTGAKGLNLWSSFRVAAAAAQRAALSRARRARPRVVGVRAACCRPSSRSSTRVSVTATEGTPLGVGRKRRCSRRSTDVERDGITDAELAKAKAQLRARLVFDNDSVTNIAHQLGYFETIASVDLFTAAPARIAAVTLEEVAAAARARARRRRTAPIGWFEPMPSAARVELEAER